MDSQEDTRRYETSTDNNDVLDSLYDNLDISKDIKKKMTCLEEAQRKLREDNQRSERIILDKLNQILQMNRSQSSQSANDICASSLQQLQTANDIYASTLQKLQTTASSIPLPPVPRKSRFDCYTSTTT